MPLSILLGSILIANSCSSGNKTDSNQVSSKKENQKKTQTESIQSTKPVIPTVTPEAATPVIGNDEESEILVNEGSAQEEAMIRNTFAAALPFSSGDDKVCAVAYLGNTKEAKEENQNAFYIKYFKDYTKEQLAAIPEVNFGGEECYLIVPRYQESKISLNMMELKDNRINILRTEEVEAEAFLLYCNPSQEYANAEVSISYGEKNFVIMPRLSDFNHRMENMQIALDLTEESVYQTQ